MNLWTIYIPSPHNHFIHCNIKMLTIAALIEIFPTSCKGKLQLQQLLLILFDFILYRQLHHIKRAPNNKPA